MTTSDNTHFSKYIALRDKIEIQSEKLASVHSKHMHCQKGCDQCCIDYMIFPLEFHFILNELKKKKTDFTQQNKTEENVCVFLKNHSCSIYEQRPLICRTHGLPLLFMNDNSEWELSACELNFTKFDFGNFTLENTFPQDKYNSKLFLLNKEFIGHFKEKKYGEMDLISIKKLLDYL